MRTARLKRHYVFLFVTLLLWAAFVSWLAIAQVQGLNSRYGFDLAHFTEWFWKLVHDGDTLSLAVAGNFRTEGPALWNLNHFQPIRYLMLPLFALWPRVECLLVIQTAVLCSGALSLFLTVQRRSGSLALAWLLVGIYLSWDLALGYGLNDFRPLHLALPLSLHVWAAGLEAGRPLTTGLWGALLLSVREEMLIVVPLLACLGAYAAFRDRRDPSWKKEGAQARHPKRRRSVGVLFFLTAIFALAYVAFRSHQGVPLLSDPKDLPSILQNDAPYNAHYTIVVAIFVLLAGTFFAAGKYASSGRRFRSVLLAATTSLFIVGTVRTVLTVAGLPAPQPDAALLLQACEEEPEILLLAPLGAGAGAAHRPRFCLYDSDGPVLPRDPAHWLMPCNEKERRARVVTFRDTRWDGADSECVRTLSSTKDLRIYDVDLACFAGIEPAVRDEASRHGDERK